MVGFAQPRDRSRGNPTFGFPLPQGTPFLFPFPVRLSCSAVQRYRSACDADDLVCLQKLAATRCAMASSTPAEAAACSLALGGPLGVCGENACVDDATCGPGRSCVDHVCRPG